MRTVKVIGAGSIGNHLSNASRRIGCQVVLCDVDPKALERTKSSIYPGRYGAWDEGIALHVSGQEPKGGFDLICVGTPPDSHMQLALEALSEKPKAVLIEKPLCTPSLENLQELVEKARAAGVHLFVGYDHVVGAACEEMTTLISGDAGLGQPLTLDVEFREHWSGIFAAHPWLSGPEDTYLGYWRRGGGASGEHSHALNLWQHYARALGAGRVVEVEAMLDYVKEGAVDYDRLALFHLKTETGFCGRVVQDVVTNPPRKWARTQFSSGYVEWHCGFQPGCDAVFAQRNGEDRKEMLFKKTRPDDFIRELEHIRNALSSDPSSSPLAARHGIDTMLVVAAAHRAQNTGRRVRIDYTKGATTSALTDS